MAEWTRKHEIAWDDLASWIGGLYSENLAEKLSGPHLETATRWLAKFAPSDFHAVTEILQVEVEEIKPYANPFAVLRPYLDRVREDRQRREDAQRPQLPPAEPTPEVAKEHLAKIRGRFRGKGFDPLDEKTRVPLEDD